MCSVSNEIGIYVEVELLCLTFGETSKPFSRVLIGTLFWNLNSNVREIQFIQILTNNSYCLSFLFRGSRVDMRWCLMVFVIALITNDVDHLSMCFCLFEYLL